MLSGPDVGGSTATENHMETMLDGEVRRSGFVSQDSRTLTAMPRKLKFLFFDSPSIIGSDHLSTASVQLTPQLRVL